MPLVFVAAWLAWNVTMSDTERAAWARWLQEQDR